MSYPKPKTISELLEFCQLMKMPLRSMRFFIGEDCPEPKAFGIFQNPDGEFVVYKNKADGTRAIRYKGPDEAFAVNEIYQKLKSETELRKNTRGNTGYTPQPSADSGYETAVKRSRAPLGIGWNGWFIIILLIGIIIICIRQAYEPDRGYYRHNDVYYYYDSDDWYYYDDGWIITDAADLMFDDYDDYYLSNDYIDGYDINDFRYSDYYDGYYERSTNDDYNDDYDDYDWDFDYDDWDPGDTDWDTDW